MGAPTAAQQSRPAVGVELVGPVEHAPVPGNASTLGYKFADLAAIDSEHPLADEMAGQTLSLFGREDLIAGRSSDYKASRCAPASGAADVFTEIRDRARQTSIVIVNESHERSQHRGFIAEVARQLRPLGYDTLAMETLSNSLPGTPTQHLPLFLRQPTLSYLVDEDGYYVSEAGFGRLGRMAKALGYSMLPYEFIDAPSARAMTRDERVARREEGQARNLAAFLKDHPAAKLLIHVGYSHAAEVPRNDGARWMAARLKEKTGIDPLTISQTTCRGGGDALRLSTLPVDEPAGTFDLVVDHPAAWFDRGRPAWRRLMGDQMVDVPRALRPRRGWRVIEARPVGEPVTSVPMDRVAIRGGEDVALMLPPGRYRLRVIDLPVAGGKTPVEPAR